jgi:hypothetical protein
MPITKIIPPKWISILDQEPKNGEIVITYHNLTGIDIMKCHHLKGKNKMFGKLMFTCCKGFLTDDVTHWIPLDRSIQKTLSKLRYV